MSINKHTVKSGKSSLTNNSNNGSPGKMPALVPPVLREVSKLAAGVASVSTASNSSSSGSATGNPRNKCALQPGHSLMDWIRLGSSGKDLTGVGQQAGHLAVTKHELAKHNTEKDAWLAIRGKVYNITAYLPFHPGGHDELMKGAGRDATSLFDQVHPWVNYDQILQKCFIGRLVALDPSINTQNLFTNKPKTPPKLVQSPIQANNNIETTTINEEIILPRFDWIQKMDTITIIFYTKAFSNPLLEIFQSAEDQGILILISYDGTLFSNEIIFFKQVHWPCNIKITIETGKIELFFKKSHSCIWDNYGVLRQKSRSTGSFSANVKYNYVICDKIKINHNTWLFKLDRSDGSKLVVPIGKHIRVFGNINGMEMTRSYTPVPESLFNKFLPNNQSTDNICLMVKRYDSGNVSKYLIAKEIDELIQLTKPMGDFNVKLLEKRETFLLLAAGTGLTPMLSLIIFLLERRIKKCQFIRLMFFNKTERDILFKQKLDLLSAEDSRFKIDYVLSEPSANWTGLRDHVNKEMVLNSLQEHLKDTGYTIRDIYCCVCGPNQFNLLSKQVLNDIEFNDEQIHIFQG